MSESIERAEIEIKRPGDNSSAGGPDLLVKIMVPESFRKECEHASLARQQTMTKAYDDLRACLAAAPALRIARCNVFWRIASGTPMQSWTPAACYTMIRLFERAAVAVGLAKTGARFMSFPVSQYNLIRHQSGLGSGIELVKVRPGHHLLWGEIYRLDTGRNAKRGGSRG